MSLHPLTTTMISHHQTANINNNPKGGATINKGVGTPTNDLNIANPTTTTIHHKNSQNSRYQPPHNRQPYPSNTNSQPSYEDTIRASHQKSKEMREATKRTEAQISHLIDLLTKLTNQVLPSTSTPPPPPNPSPLPSQPLPNPKGGINMIKKGDEKKEERRARTEWLLELMAKVDNLVDPDDEDWWDEWDEEDEEDPKEEEEEWEIEEEDAVELEGGKEEVIREVVEKKQVGETLLEENKIVEECGKLCLTMVFVGNKMHKIILPVKCEDPGPCLVTCEIRGINIRDCLCDLGACASVMSYELYVLLDLGPLKTTNDVFTTTDMGIVSIAGIAEDGGTPQVLLGRPTLKTAGFKLDYIFKVGKVEEIYHPERSPASNKKFAHQVQLGSEDKVEGKKSKEAKERLERGKGLRHSPPHIKKKKKDPMKKKVKIRNQEKESSKEEGKEEKGKRRIELKCNSVEDLIGKLLTFKKVLHNNDAMSNHLVKDQSKWK
ncbi:hypothetical protein PIB30_052987 [Stylosanthes scabra]|uniref:Uncharacterized protein n=1 Tax=Stylosanthes scabra TaxID=79078 RepID=A0ABU6VHM8_9FABA|nr:hypothetical protein [Stylosanthes scabra]